MVFGDIGRRRVGGRGKERIMGIFYGG